MKKIFFFFLLAISTLNAIIDYDRAIVQTQKNNWPAAQELLTSVVVENPDRVDTLYDLGVAAYKNNNFDTALTYFNKAANHSQANTALQQQAHFNAGNTHVQLKQLQQAIDAYDRVLALKPDHEQALHNKEAVKKMMEEEQKKENKDDQDKNKNQDDKKEPNKDNQKQDQSNDTKDKDKEDNQDQQNQKQGQQDKKEENQKDKQENNQDQNQSQQEQKKSEQNNNEDSDTASPAHPEEHHSDASGRMTDKQTQAGTGSQPAQAQNKNQQEQKLSAGLARVLEDREKKDAQLNKKMTKALVANQGGGKNDYNCW